MATSVQDRDQAAPSGVRRAARTGYRWLLLVFLLAVAVQTCLLQSLLDGLADNTAVFGGLHALDGLLIAASAGVQYALARRR
jgi:hypothetical protein